MSQLTWFFISDFSVKKQQRASDREKKKSNRVAGYHLFSCLTNLLKVWFKAALGNDKFNGLGTNNGVAVSLSAGLLKPQISHDSRFLSR